MRFTVFTPTYNRRDTLSRVHRSLTRQTTRFGCFEWLIVDDGSTDGTGELVKEWQATSPFAIRYLWQANQGKHRAWNRGVGEARGELMAFIDSDDGCVPAALERFEALWSAVPEDERRGLAGVIARCQYPDGQPMGRPMPKVQRADFAELLYVHRWNDETWIVARTDVLRSYLFPDGPERLLVPEGTVWHRISRDYRWVIADECLKVYFTGDRFGRPDQLSKPRSMRQQAPGMALALESMLSSSFRYFSYAPGLFFRSAVHYCRFSMHAKLPLTRQIQRLEPPGARALCLLGLPIAYAAYAADLARGRS